MDQSARTITTNTTNTLRDILPGIEETSVRCPNCQELVTLSTSRDLERVSYNIYLICNSCGFNRVGQIYESAFGTSSMEGPYYVVKQVLDDMLNTGSDLLTDTERELEAEALSSKPITMASVESILREEWSKAYEFAEFKPRKVSKPKKYFPELKYLDAYTKSKYLKYRAKRV